MDAAITPEKDVAGKSGSRVVLFYVHVLVRIFAASILWLSYMEGEDLPAFKPALKLDPWCRSNGSMVTDISSNTEHELFRISHLASSENLSSELSDELIS
ncbi:hypothetical protein CVT25_002540 [Psilocybe cyanescens]|uniref:Uncharacterized protein n=1 Tax=Psilocybe cyanescens TaxID=93625 RepID=A0A409XUE5_PSICY|nr:hypothetical protein CVT25_002540 [Psilocybe cyanescens]